MESILARALEYTLKYWLKSFSRDQFKLQGRTAQLSNLGYWYIYISSSPSFYLSNLPIQLNFDSILLFCLLDINGDALHASLGLPPALHVTTARVGKLEIIVSHFFLSHTVLLLFSSSLSFEDAKKKKIYIVHFYSTTLQLITVCLLTLLLLICIWSFLRWAMFK